MSSLPKNISINELEKKYGKFDFTRTLTLLNNFGEILEAVNEHKLWSYEIHDNKSKLRIIPFTAFGLDLDGSFIKTEREIKPEDFFTIFEISIN